MENKAASTHSIASAGTETIRTPKLPDGSTFQDTLLHTLNTPEMQKAAVSGLIEKIIVHPTAALEVQCSFSSLFSNNSATGNRTPV